MYAFAETEQLNIGLFVQWLPPCMSKRAEIDTTSSCFPMAGPCGARTRASIGQLKVASLKAALTSTGSATMNNTITVIGYVGQNPHAIAFEDTGNKVVKFSVAVKEFSANNDEDKTLWLDIDAWNGLGERVLKAVTKGREIVIHGRLALTTFNKEVNGTKVEITKPLIKLTSFHLCGRKPADVQSESNDIASRKKARLSSVKN